MSQQSEQDFMAMKRREVCEGWYWATYRAVLSAYLPRLELDVAIDLARAGAEKSHGTLEEIRRK